MIRRSIVDTHNDFVEALAFAADGKMRTHYGVNAIEIANSIFRLHAGRLDSTRDCHEHQLNRYFERSRE
jgi:alcohol dehydrogenase, propanol-preferring